MEDSRYRASWSSRPGPGSLAKCADRDPARLARARDIIEHSYGRLAQLDTVAAHLVDAHADLVAELEAVRREAIRAAWETIERHLRVR